VAPGAPDAGRRPRCRRPQGEGLPGSQAQLGHDERLAGRRRQQQVGADLLHGRAALGQQLRRLRVPALAVAEGKAVVDGGADDRMEEPAWRLRPEELGPTEHRERVGRRLPLQAGKGGGVAQVRAVAQDRHGVGEAGGLLRKSRQP
jgi:hypothetical protein